LPSEITTAAVDPSHPFAATSNVRSWPSRTCGVLPGIREPPMPTLECRCRTRHQEQFLLSPEEEGAPRRGAGLARTAQAGIGERGPAGRERCSESHTGPQPATNVQVYFCDPRSPWQRGSNENTNGLLRQYFPRGTDLSHFSQAYLNKIALRLNQRPRKTLGFETPADRLRAVLQ
jgi:hypothetical protein